ncbi:two-component sensor histidine kinase [Alteromonas aestuariivivens]|uniref:histidine kinase n=1 Tax=Alteromonas aestuariivivens TaxID=1938339 RepID=A0A3D8M9W1_9ALTE|nr:ATP-binding protein [Alteromonas aestuariivivens]RDV26769.1 two-component sensor histidine kinase [Alteromonas aestuariivivens]
MASMRRYLTLLLICSLVVIIFAAAIHGYRATMNVSSELLDRELESVLQTVASSHHIQSERIRTTDIAFQIWQNDTLLERSANAPLTPMAPQVEEYSDRNFDNTRWRTHVRHIGPQGIWIMVAQPLQNRFELTESMTVSSVMPAVLSVPVLAFVVFWAVSWGLSPLKRLSAQLSGRKGKDLSQISLAKVPQELQPVVTTLNSMFGRLHDAFEREQQFASNAAHELRTPLSVMKINLHNLAQELGDKQDKLASLQQDTNRMIHVVNQILLLSRTSPEMFQSQRVDTNLYQVAQQVITDLYSKIESKQQQIELHGDAVTIISNEFVLYTLIQNLLANAIAYSPEAALLRVSIRKHTGEVVLDVEDSGPGIPLEERQNVMQRFYRDQQDSRYKSHGSGLGLAIVGQIVQLHNGRIELGDSPLGGLRVRVIFPHTEGERTNDSD